MKSCNAKEDTMKKEMEQMQKIIVNQEAAIDDMKSHMKEMEDTIEKMKQAAATQEARLITESDPPVAYHCGYQDRQYGTAIIEYDSMYYERTNRWTNTSGGLDIKTG